MLCGCRLSADDITALGGSIVLFNVNRLDNLVMHQSVTLLSLGVLGFFLFTCLTGEALTCTPLLEVLDLSWNSGVGGDALQGMLGKVSPSLRELYLVACQLTAADVPVLGTDITFH